MYICIYIYALIYIHTYICSHAYTYTSACLSESIVIVRCRHLLVPYSATPTIETQHLPGWQRTWLVFQLDPSKVIHDANRSHVGAWNFMGNQRWESTWILKWRYVSIHSIPYRAIFLGAIYSLTWASYKPYTNMVGTVPRTSEPEMAINRNTLW